MPSYDLSNTFDYNLEGEAKEKFEFKSIVKKIIKMISFIKAL